MFLFFLTRHLHHFFLIIRHGSCMTLPSPSAHLLFLVNVSRREILFMILGSRLNSADNFSRCFLMRLFLWPLSSDSSHAFIAIIKVVG